MSGLRKALFFSFVEKYLLAVLGFISSLFIARLLTPAEIGVFSIGAMLAGLLHVLRDFGVGSYVTQLQDLDRKYLQSALGVAWLSGSALSLLLFICASPCASFYGDARLEQVMRILGLSFLIAPAGSLVQPVLRRQMRGGAICIINLASGAASCGVPILLAWQGFGTISLAFGSLAGAIATVLACAFLRPANLPWMPSFHGMQPVLTFGTTATAGTLMDEAGVASPELIAGKALGSEAIAVFGKAQGLLAMFRQAVLGAASPVLQAHFSNCAHGHGSANDAYLNSLRHFTALSWPFHTFCALMAFDLIRLLFGDQWDEAAALLPVLCLASGIYGACVLSRYLFLAVGAVRTQARLDSLAAFVRVLVVFPGLAWGIAGLAWSAVAAAVFRLCLVLRYLRVQCGLGAIETLVACRSSACLAILVGMGTWVGTRFGFPLLIQCTVAAVVWMFGLFLLRHPLYGEFIGFARRLIEGRAP